MANVWQGLFFLVGMVPATCQKTSLNISSMGRPYFKKTDQYVTVWNQGWIGNAHVPSGATYDQRVGIGQSACDSNSKCVMYGVDKADVTVVALFDATHAPFFPHSDWDFFLFDPCAVSSVSGKWQAQFTVAAPTTITFKHGTTKTESLTKTTTWSGEVTTHVESDFKIFGFGGTASVDAKVGLSVANTYQSEWSMNTEEDFQVGFQQDDVGKYVWQFQFAVDDACESGAQSVTKEYALTAGAWEEPCCIPGYCVDAPQCNTCHEEQFLIPGAEKPRCKVAKPDSKNMVVV